MQKNSLVAPGEIVREALSKPTIFKNEEPLSLEWLPPRLPHRGCSSEELLHILLDQLETKNLHIILTLDEADVLIAAEGSTSLYNLTRIQEERPGRPIRLSLIVVLREIEKLQDLDRSTQSTLQRNLIRLDRYSTSQLESILRERVELAIKEGTISEQVVDFVADMAAPAGDARYAIELVWRAGKYADTEGSREVQAEHVRAAAQSVYPVMRTDYAQHLNLHEKLLLLGLARTLERTQETYASMGESEIAYKMACEEYKEQPRAHTQVWKYVQNLSATGIVSTQPSTAGFRGKTTLLGLPTAPASAIRRWLESSLVRRP